MPEVLDNPIQTEEPQEELSLRETIEKAVDSSAGEEAPGGGAPVEPGDQKAGTTGTTGTPEAKQPDGKQPDGQHPAAPTGATATPAGQPGELKAPSQWRPAVREKWNQLPREVQEEVLRREGDALRLIGSVGQKIRMADEVAGHLQPFMEKLQASGAQPSDFLGDVFSTIKSLSMGNPLERAEVVANIVQSYGIDLRALDAVLTRRLQMPPEVMEARRMAAQAQAVMSRQTQQQENQNLEGANQVLETFQADPKNEFFNDVRYLMADLMEAGQAQTLDDAYIAAAWAHPDTRKILLQREAQQRAGAKHQRASAARLASSSIHGTPRGPVGPAGLGQNMSLRDTIAAAMDAQESA